jgi:hypothetical protein
MEAHTGDYTPLPNGEDVVESIIESQQLLHKGGDYGYADDNENDLLSSSSFKDVPVPLWWEQITVRGLVVSGILGCVFCLITHKLNLTVGVIPSLNVAAGLLGFFFVKSWTVFLSKLGISSKPFTRQENTVIQTCVVACMGLAFSGT